ncbi:hypothetical protein [Nocardiopsis sp. JB363]|uniref:hypothetical protein n=1 Tax=Nocardiopsis sp. JB363 TaxID=1434837 RepID=UPI00097AD43E|nr:hypothetical protein [Nocardiopsis sp. JB363]SIO90987.1 hypothetical protein BQ8420_29470 [Nocardiopsis sp. JB363]
MTASPATTRRVEPNGDSWDWYLPSSGALPTRNRPPVSLPAREIGGSVAFLPPSPSDDGYEIYRSVRGRLTIADALRAPVALPIEAERGLPHLVHLAVKGCSSEDDTGTDPSPALWEVAHRFLEECADLGIEEASRVRALLGRVSPDPAFLRYSSQSTLGLGRLVLGAHPDTGEPRFDTATALVPSVSVPLVLNLSRTLAEIQLTTRLFAAAGKSSAPSLSRVAASYGALAVGDSPSRVATLRTGAAVLVVDHARRLASVNGIDPPTVALELSVAAALLDRAADGSRT